MKNTTKLLLGLSLMILSCTNAQAQLTQTRAEVITSFGFPTATGTTEDGTPYIYYDKNITTVASGQYLQRKAMFFTTADDGNQICYMWKVLEPSTETNWNVNYYKSQYVEIGNMRYKDFEHNIIYDLDVKDGLCITLVWLDSAK